MGYFSAGNWCDLPFQPGARNGRLCFITVSCLPTQTPISHAPPRFSAWKTILPCANYWHSTSVAAVMM